MSISVIIASIPGRKEYLQRAINSVMSQSLMPDKIIIGIDNDRLGAARNRDRCIESCDTDYIAILDDDDFLLPNHIEILFNTIKNNDADLVYPSWMIEQGFISHLDHIMGKPWNNNEIHQVPITWMAKTSSILEVGGFSKNFEVMENNFDEHGHRIGEDFIMIKKLVNSGKKIMHINEITWSWNCGHIGSTQGRPDRW